jgi:AraC-like DNA-binding protein
MDVTTVTSILIFSYGVVFLSFSMAILALRSKRDFHWVGASFLASFGVMCVFGGVHVSKGPELDLVNLAVFVPMLFVAFTGSLVALNCLGSIKRRSRFITRIACGSGLIMFAGIILMAMNVEWRVIYTLSYVWLLTVFTSIAVMEGKGLMPFSTLPKAIYRFFCVLTLDIALIFGMLITNYLELTLILYVLWYVQIMSIFVLILNAFHSPAQFRLLESEINKARYERVTVPAERVKATISRLETLMCDEELFRDPSLRLEDLAKLVGLSSHQLSELLNLRLGQNFSQFIGSYRVRHAEKLLIERPEMNVLEIAFECGFNSKSVFNAAFRASVGLTPTMYRKSVTRDGGCGPSRQGYVDDAR